MARSPTRIERAQPFTLVHSADLHLGSAMAVADRLGRADDLKSASYEALEHLVDLVEDQEARILTLAGDLFDVADQENPFPRRRLSKSLERIPESAVAVVRGNHDHHMEGAPRPRYPEHVFEFEGERATWDLGWVRLHGVSYDRQHVRESLLPRYPPASRDHFDIGLLHANVGGNTDHAPYAPCTVTDLVGHGYRMWLLGHVHKRAVLCEEPLVLYPGNLQGRHARETGARTAEVIQVDAGGSVTHEPVPVHSVLWLEEAVDVSAAQDEEQVIDLVLGHCERRRKALGRERGAVARLRLMGASDLHRRLMRTPAAGEPAFAQVVQEMVNERFAQESPFFLVDRVLVDTRIALDLAALEDAPDMAGVLVRLAQDPSMRREALAQLKDGPVDEEELEALLESLWERGLHGALARVVGVEEA